MELIYACISKLAVYLTKTQPDIIPEQLKHYADPNDYNRIFYHQRNDDMQAVIQRLLTDSGCLLHLCRTDFEDVTEYQLSARCLSGRTVVENEKRRMRTERDGTKKKSFRLQTAVMTGRTALHYKKSASFTTSKNASNRAERQLTFSSVI